IFYGDNGIINGGNHIIEIAYFYNNGYIYGNNKIDTALFYTKGQIEGSNIIDTTIIYKQGIITGQNNIRTATLKNNGIFNGNNIFNYLTFNYGKEYIFEHDSTQTIIDEFNANGRCTGPIILQSDFNSKQACIKKENGNIEVEYVSLRDMKALGLEIPFIANNSVDLGNNTDWTINMAQPLALYWVNGTGVWSDSLHWAGISGGTGGYCIPTPIDDVYFDENSFYSQNATVYIDIENAICRNMDWTGSQFNPVFTGPAENKLKIYGSLKFIDNMNFDFSGKTYFEATDTGKTIISAGQEFNNIVTFQGRNGGWILIDSLSTKEVIYLIYGSLETYGNNINCHNFISNDTNSRVLLLSNSTITLNGSGDTWFVNAENLILDASSSFILSNGNVISENGELLIYNNIHFTGGNCNLKNDSVYGKYNLVTFDNSGSIRGDCTIDTVLFYGSGNIYDSDSINFVNFKSQGNIIGGNHIIKSAIFNGNGSITGNNIIDSAIFNNNGSITGNNIIDTTIIYGNGNIFEDNIINNTLIIYGDGNINGDNVINNTLIIYGHAFIFGNNSINKATLFNWGDFGGTNIFNNLKLTPGNTYTLEYNKTQTINNDFSIRGNNCFFITLQSSKDNYQANISKPSGIVSGDFINMKDINATGGATFYAGGHTDSISNNTGWIFDNAPDYIYGLTNDTTICDGDTLILTTENFNADSNAVFQWEDGSISPTYMVTDSGMYRVTVYYSVYPDTCSVPDSIYVALYPKPEIKLGEDKSLCEGELIELEIGSGYESYLWSNGSTDTCLSVTESGMYWIEVWDENGCSDRDTINLTVIPIPDVFLGNDTILYFNDFITLNAGFPGSVYEWSTGDNTQTITVQGEEEGIEYWVIVDNKNCIGYDTIFIREYPYCIVELPTAFTPNGDGINDTLYVRGSGFAEIEFSIFNRFGEMVFKTDNYKIGWDGKFNGVKQEVEVYIYYFKAICFDGHKIQKKGNVTLLK
ncbi:MAG: gliding motility-associated C-terminal domain-containing protein, partial [Bacteroidales bacterium]|nr:gliding motility-associated C-terminal domain-containing protein [Bacteroidales bacterium]